MCKWELTPRSQTSCLHRLKGPTEAIDKDFFSTNGIKDRPSLVRVVRKESTKISQTFSIIHYRLNGLKLDYNKIKRLFLDFGAASDVVNTDW